MTMGHGKLDATLTQTFAYLSVILNDTQIRLRW